MIEVTCSGLLFDLDGVLVDSTPAVARVWSKWAIAHGFDPEETVRQAHGRPSIETVRDILPGADFEKENEIILRGEIEDTEGVIPLPGARELLSSIPEDQWALVTSCARPLAEVRLRAAGLPMQKRWPLPRMYSRLPATAGVAITPSPSSFFASCWNEGDAANTLT